MPLVHNNAQLCTTDSRKTHAMRTLIYADSRIKPIVNARTNNECCQYLFGRPVCTRTKLTPQGSHSGRSDLQPRRCTIVDEVLPHQPMRQWVLSVPFPLRFLFASQPDVMGRVLGIVYRTIATHLTHKAGYTNSRAHTGAVTLIQRFGGAVNLIQHYVGCPYDIHGKYKRSSSVQTYGYVLLGTRLKETGPITNAIAYRAFGIMYAIIPTIIMLGRGSNRVQNLFKFLVVSLMTATAVAGNALALDPPESELTTAHTLRNVFIECTATGRRSCRSHR